MNLFQNINNINNFNNFIESNLKAEEEKLEQAAEVDQVEQVEEVPCKKEMLGKKRGKNQTKKDVSVDYSSSTSLINSRPQRNKSANLNLKKQVSKSEDYTSQTYSSDQTYLDKRTIFKTVRGDEEVINEMRKEMRLMKNRLSARKCRQKKKNYVRTMEKKLAETEAELEKYKRIQKADYQTERIIDIVILYKYLILYIIVRSEGKRITV